MDRLKKDLDHIKAEGIDSGALYKRVCKYLAELVAYKDTGLTPEAVAQLKQIAEIFNCDPADAAQLKDLCIKLSQAELDGRLVVLPEVPEDDRQAFVEGLQDYFQDASNYDPSVGIFGMRSGEAKLANALMAGLTRPEAEAALARLKGENSRE